MNVRIYIEIDDNIRTPNLTLSRYVRQLLVYQIIYYEIQDINK